MGDGCLFRLLVCVSSAVHLGRTVCFTTSRSYHQEKQLARTEMEMVVMYENMRIWECRTRDVFPPGKRRGERERAGDVVRERRRLKKKERGVETGAALVRLSVEGGRRRTRPA
ncbi:hypothetical protein H105_07829 [Trichophyton soudanense CBS 452.61]|uniref:Secreted protein n=1 Tax=Trichophyton soudanense CBS 452.61 TaxID=1215331 RepID=A0A022XH63_TRISD|nr:hypothetical protein H105_07829 [Trichophyton soudanense CBS 452.61]EZG02070.1 hypothetical protein H106_07663 [Trichophyton rubrum CBS 735.88]